MKTKLIALMIAASAAFASTSAMADATVTNTDKQYGLKVIYKVPGKQYGACEDCYGSGFDNGKISVYPFDEEIVAPGKTATVKGKVLGTVKMIPGPELPAILTQSLG